MQDKDGVLWKYEQALHYEIFVKEEYAVAKEQIKKADHIIDIWGHIGLFSERCLSLNPKVNIQFFEPFPQNLDRAKKRLKPREKQIMYYPFAVSGKVKGNQTFSFNPEKTMQSSKEASFLNPRGEKQEVYCISLSQVLEKVKKADLIKMDIEGMEFEVLENSTEKERRKISNLLCEVHLLDHEKEVAWEKLQVKLRSVFPFFEWIPNPYRPELGIAFYSY